MSLKTLLGLGKKLFGKKPQQSPATGKEQKLLTYDEAASKKSGLELAEQEIKNPPSHQGLNLNLANEEILEQ